MINFEEYYERFTPKYGKGNCLVLKTSNQPLTVLRKLTNSHI